MSVVVAPPERTSLEQVSAALIGDEANALAQLGLLIATLLILALLTRRRKNKSSADPWQNTDFEAGEEQTEKVFEKHALLEQVQNRRPVNSPSSVLFALSEVPSNLAPAPQPVEPQLPTPTTEPQTSQQPLQQAELHPPIPESGLPEGWTEEQWSHYGQQYLDAQSSHP